MAATLPVGKGMDQDKGRKRFAVYATILGHHSNEALSFMARTACETLDWFPTPRQCIAILKDFRAPRSDRDIALGYCHEFTQARFEAWMESVTAGTATADEIADVPDRWRRIAVERGGLRRLPDGDYIIRKPKADDACAPEDEAI